jgi:hypothetical protein
MAVAFVEVEADADTIGREVGRRRAQQGLPADEPLRAATW